MNILSFDIGSKNLAYCLINNLEEILLWNVVDISATTYDQQCQKLIKALDAINLDNPDTIVVIEKQPSFNPKMRVISGQVQMYYALQKYRESKIKKVIYYSPKNKLKCYQVHPNDEPIIEKKYSTKYNTRKYIAKQQCERIIKRNEHGLKWLDFYTSNKKKDDLSDSFLQALAYNRGFK